MQKMFALVSFVSYSLLWSMDDHKAEYDTMASYIPCGKFCDFIAHQKLLDSFDFHQIGSLQMHCGFVQHGIDTLEYALNPRNSNGYGLLKDLLKQIKDHNAAELSVTDFFKQKRDSHHDASAKIVMLLSRSYPGSLQYQYMEQQLPVIEAFKQKGQDPYEYIVQQQKNIKEIEKILSIQRDQFEKPKMQCDEDTVYFITPKRINSK